MLEEIKISGFKSFVDPCILKFPSKLVGIVGPNGCGKSNIIDAIRFVIGVSRARELRGENLPDVIFNGASERKPSGQASAELIFDNSDGKFGNTYQAYAKIAIKRVVTRDGESEYYFNGQQCRRRDILDIFLGTGLGRSSGQGSYAIVEQGIINRILDAKPEEFRVYIEEAAGISKYKERRRETENRMRHTQENLERLNDIRKEKRTYLERLQKQAKAAERFRILETEKNKLEQEWLATRFHQTKQTCQQHQDDISKIREEKETYVLKWNESQLEMHEIEQIQNALQKSLKIAEQGYHQKEINLARLQENEKQCQYELKQIQGAIEQTQVKLNITQEKYTKNKETSEQLDADLQALQENLSKEQELSTQLKNHYEQYEQELAELQIKWEELTQRSAEHAQEAHTEQLSIQHLEEQLKNKNERFFLLSQLKPELELEEINQQTTILSLKIENLELSIEQNAEIQKGYQAQIEEKENEILTLQDQLSILNNKISQAQGRLSSLKTLQEAALGSDSNVINSWLKQHALDKAPRLAHLVKVTPGCEKLVSHALKDFLQAPVVSSISDAANQLADLTHQSLLLINPFSSYMNEKSSEVSGHEQKIGSYTKNTLAHQIESPHPNIKNLLKNITYAQDLSQAFTQLSQEPEIQYVLTKDGFRVGHGWIERINAKEPEDSILFRERLIKQTENEISVFHAQKEELEEKRDEQNAFLKNLQAALQETQTEALAIHADLARTQAEHANSERKLQDAQKKLLETSEEAQRLREQINQIEIQLEQTKAKWSETLNAITQDNHHRETLKTSREQLHHQLQEARILFQEQQEKTQLLNITLTQRNSEQNYLRQSYQNLQEHQHELENQLTQLNIDLKSLQISDSNNEYLLSTLIEEHAKLKAEVDMLKTHLSDHNAKHAQKKNEQTALQDQLQTLNDACQKLELTAENLNARALSLKEQLSLSYEELTSLSANLSSELKDELSYKTQIEQLQKRIQSLGAINLAAIEEHQALAEEVAYLDTQYTDLTQALESLCEAINKIDKETRAHFQTTFSEVNQNFQKLFPRLFGGGQAFLELTSPDLLHCGVSVIARPPGKRNSLLQLLSGGEKALTAVALIFAIFQLQPAPFCLLDEVDAPLDEANVGRFYQLVKEMSQKVQFIFITHNKFTMELAEHLIGVTMSEPGVSRLVSVDIAEALRLAELET